MNTQTLKIILTGATGMVGEGVLHECLLHSDVERVLVINRKPCGVSHPKLKEIIHSDFFDLSPIEHELVGYNTSLFCSGVSSVGMDEHNYYKLTYTLTMYVAQTLSRLNDGMTFCYISGAATDKKGRMMWARVKGKTENDLMKLPFKNVYNFRPGILQPTKGLKNTLRYYKYVGWLLPIIKILAPKTISSLKELGIAMINAASKGYAKHIIEVSDIHLLSKQ
ncbi:epimerase [Ferruginibacter lapsinanis]|uniref:epimerase n=1 Tax=Ferruginibacter lapsinanis TaxID=563172 RepID=UPI001E4FA908|nr:epimerase [Ferruginibacter lapsinanis]UEG48730.1 epimerase [Ferruginibacter lapsinanis]